MNVIKKNWTKITSFLILLSASADTIFDLLSQLGLSVETINIIKLIGLLTSILLPSIFQTEDKKKFVSKYGEGAVIPNKGF